MIYFNVFCHTAEVFISTDQNPSNFTAFNVSSSGAQLPLAVQPFSASGEGAACIAIDIQNLGIQGINDGSNVSLQVRFNGGDGDLWQVIQISLRPPCTGLTLFSCISVRRPYTV